MKRLICALTVCCMMLTALSSLFLLNVGAQNTKELDATTKAQLDFTDSYYYDRISEKQQEYYHFLKAFYDEQLDEAGIYRYNWSSFLPPSPTLEDCDKLFDDLKIASLAIEADYPLYAGIAYISGCSSGFDGTGNVEFFIEITRPNFATDHVKKYADARIQQIVKTVGVPSPRPSTRGW